MALQEHDDFIDSMIERIVSSPADEIADHATREKMQRNIMNDCSILDEREGVEPHVIQALKAVIDSVFHNPDEVYNIRDAWMRKLTAGSVEEY